MGIKTAEIAKKNTRRLPKVGVVERVYHHAIDVPTNGISHSYDYETESDEQVYTRNTTVSEESIKLSLGWFDDGPVGEVIIRNEEGRFEKNPSPEEKAESNKKVIEVLFGDEVGMTIAPLRSVRFRPARPGKLKIRCQHGTAKFSLNVFPR